MYWPHQAGAVAVRAELELVADQLRDPLIPVLLAAVVLTVATGDLADASVTVLVIVVTTVRLVQEVKVGEAIAALSDLTARVVRDGEQRQIPGADVVTGDVPGTRRGRHRARRRQRDRRRSAAGR
jgi:magnesium-transporting ATPase (P-type)